MNTKKTKVRPLMDGEFQYLDDLIAESKNKLQSRHITMTNIKYITGPAVTINGKKYRYYISYGDNLYLLNNGFLHFKCLITDEIHGWYKTKNVAKKAIDRYKNM
jgi:hypothetical protein